MTNTVEPSIGSPVSVSADRSDTPLSDRKFRRDVQGLRAVAIILVVLFHADIPGVNGGFVGVDVFFVISGYVITGVLLREREATRGTSILSFYGRRVRRIIPAASLVIVVTVVASYLLLGSILGRSTAVDGQWAAVFLANLHFAASSTNYLASQKPPSALQNFWSLAVEEQFYIVYPTVFLVAAGIVSRTSVRVKVGGILTATVVGSFVLSVVLTSSNPASAFFSPFTRAWELALGGLVAVAANRLRRLPSVLAAVMTWLGLAGILVAAFTFTSATSYPGFLVAVPVVGTGLIIAGGTAGPAWGAELLLTVSPMQFIGLVSYSWYLWHWPILVLFTQRRGVTSLPVADNILLVLIALVLAVGTYLLIENPVRHSPFLLARQGISVGLGCCLIIATLAVTAAEVDHSPQTVSGALASAAAGVRCPTSQSKTQLIRSEYLASGLAPKAPPHTPPLRMVVVGDSTSCTLMEGLSAVGASYGVRVKSASVLGCGIVSGQIAPEYFDGFNFEASTASCESRAELAARAALANGPPDIVLWGSQEERSSILDGKKVLVTGTKQWHTVMLQRINSRVQQYLDTGAKVLLMLQPAIVNSPDPNKFTSRDTEFENLNSLLREVASRHPGRVAVVNLASRVCPSGPPCPYWLNIGKGHRLNVRSDDEHYAAPGALWVSEWLVPRILAAAKPLS